MAYRRKSKPALMAACRAPLVLYLIAVSGCISGIWPFVSSLLFNLALSLKRAHELNGQLDTLACFNGGF
jgi:hypothetical protein